MTTQAKPMINHDLIVAARQGLLPVREGAWLGGFGNMLGKELSQWWGTRTWWVQTLIWVLILNGITTITYEGAQSIDTLRADALKETVQTFLDLGAFAVAIGAVITLQGAIVGEKQLGTAAWVMSKPASRSAFILAKMVGNSLGILISAILIPATIFFIEMRWIMSVPLDLMSYLIGITLLALNLLFFVTLTLMLGTLFNSRGPIAGIGIGFILSGLLLKGFIPLAIMALTPWFLSQIGGALIFGDPLPSIWFVPIVATSIWIVIMTILALWRFGREEF